MAKRKIVKNENVEAINEIEKVEVANVNEETVIEKEEITEAPKIEVEEVEDTVKIVKKVAKNNKKPIMFGYIWNGQEYD